jgi:opacity protein-like surface antigen
MMMNCSKSRTVSDLKGFVLAAIFMMLLTGGTDTVFGQNSVSEQPQDRTGYFLQSGMDILPSAGSGSYTTARVLIVNGHRFNPQTSVGVGLGFTPYNDPISLIPFFFDFNYRILERGISPVLFVRAGYNFTVKSDDSFLIDSHSGGLLLHPGAGLEFPVSSQFEIYLSAGYSIDNSSYIFETWGDRTVTNDLSFRRLALGIGFKLTP